MADQFDQFLKSRLAAPDRPPDREFVLRVQAMIALEEQLAARRSSEFRELAKQLVALAAIAAPLWWIGRAVPVASLFSQSPAVGLAVLLAGFAGLVGLLGRAPDSRAPGGWTKCRR